MNDHWDLDHPFERLLVDTAVRPDPSAVSWINPRLNPGEERRVVTGIPGKTGIVYTLDRETGEFLWATPTITQNVVSGIDGATGVVTENAELIFTAAGQTVLTCPHASGGKDWEAGAYSPLTNTMYMPLRNVCSRMRAMAEPDEQDEARRLYAIAWRPELAPGYDDVGSVQAISAETGEVVWNYQQRAATMALAATGGGLVFGGDVNGRFRAFDDRTGEILWEINLGSPVSGFPITFAVDGRQYVAVSTGFGRFLDLTPELRPSANNTCSFSLCLNRRNTDHHKANDHRNCRQLVGTAILACCSSLPPATQGFVCVRPSLTPPRGPAPAPRGLSRPARPPPWSSTVSSDVEPPIQVPTEYSARHPRIAFQPRPLAEVATTTNLPPSPGTEFVQVP